MDDFQQPLFAFEAFCGGGFVHLALKEAGITVAMANDFCPKKAEIYKANFPDTQFDPRSIADLRASDIPPVRVSLNSSPCTDHSVNGLRAGFEGERGSTAFHSIRLIQEMAVLGRAPQVVEFENVTGLLSKNNGADFASLCQGLVSAGYHVGAVVMNALQFVPQNRERVFIVAVRADVVIPKGLTVTRPSRRWHPPMLQRAYKALPTDVRRAWQWWTMPSPPPRKHDLADILENGPQVRWLREERQERLASLLRPADHQRMAEARAKGILVGVSTASCAARARNRPAARRFGWMAMPAASWRARATRHSAWWCWMTAHKASVSEISPTGNGRG